MAEIHARGLEPALKRAVRRGKPLLGICIATSTGDIVACNPAFSRMFAFPSVGETIGVAWKVTNTDASLPSVSWYDSWYLSDDDVWDSSDTRINYFYQTRELTGGSSYEESRTLTLPVTGTGLKYLILVVDQNKVILETSETDNVYTALPVTILAECLKRRLPK